MPAVLCPLLSLAAALCGFPALCAVFAVASCGLATAWVCRESDRPGAPGWVLVMERLRRYLANEP